METRRKQLVEDMVCVISFLVWLEAHGNNIMWGGYKVTEAVDAIGRLVGFTREQMQEIALRKQWPLENKDEDPE